MSAPTLYCSRCLTSFSVDAPACPNLGCQRGRPEEGWGHILEPDEIFDRNYRIHRLLAMGGAGITYLARELGPDGEEAGPKLAIKVLFSNRNQGSYLRRLATEAQILQELNHPHIVEYFGFVHRAGHSPYLVTRYASGGSLLDHIRRVGVLTVQEVSAIGRQICQALEKGHEKGIIHRDLKPENVLLAEEVPRGQVPHVQLADFGIAKVDGSLNSNLTRAGAFVGTPHFAAPEQFLGAPVSHTSDIYSVGAMLHFCLMGRHLVQFADRLAPEDGHELLLNALPPAVNRPDDDPDDVARLTRILAVAMAPEPGQRCTARELSVMLAAIAEKRDPPVPDRAAAPLELRPLHTIEPALTDPGAGAAFQSVVTTTPADLPRAGKPPPRPPRPAPPPDPDPPAAPADEPSSGGRALSRGCLAFGVVPVAGLLFAFLGVAYLGANPAVWQDATARWTEADIPELTGHETDPDQKRDYRLIYESLESPALKVHIAKVCALPAGSKLRLQLVIEGDGQIRAARVQSGAEGERAGCVRSQLERARVNRGGTSAVRFPKIMEWGGS